MRRAWVIEERVLAPRVNQYGEHQLLWNCGKLHASEVSPKGITGTLTCLGLTNLPP